MSPVRVEFEGKKFRVARNGTWERRGELGKSIEVFGDDTGGSLNMTFITPTGQETYTNAEFEPVKKLEGKLIDPQDGKLKNISLEFT